MANFLNRFRVPNPQKEILKSESGREKAELNQILSAEFLSGFWKIFRLGNFMKRIRRFVRGYLARETENEFRTVAYWERALPKSIETALKETARRIQKEEIRKTLCLLTIVSFLYLGLAVLAEHWILTRGIPFYLRVILVLALVFFWLGVCWVKILPFWRWKIHPFFSAYVIERARPELKNGLLNLLFLLRKERLVQYENGEEVAKNEVQETSRNQSEILERRVLNLLEIQTARQVSGVGAVSSLSKGELKRWISGAVCVVILFFGYAIFAPKSSFQSIARMLFPWSKIEAPTRVRILDVRSPEFLYQGDDLSVSADIRGLNEGEKAVFFYSSEDRKYSNVPVLMENNGEKGVSAKPRFQWSANVTDVRQTLLCRVEAGDAVKREFQVKVVPPLRAEILDVSLEPPAYSRLPVVRQKAGDLRAIDGTRVSLSIRTSEPAKNVQLLLDRQGNDGSFGKQTIDFFPISSSKQGETLFRTSVLLKRSDEDDNTANENLTARIVFMNRQGIENRPLTYQWKIIADRKPEIRIIEGPPDETEVKVSDEIRISFEASDPDFGLRAVAASALWNGKRLHIPPLLNLPMEKEGIKAPFQGNMTFRAADWGLEAGDEIFWWIEAADTRRPKANRTETRKRRLRIAVEEEIPDRKKNSEIFGMEPDVEETPLKDQTAERMKNEAEETFRNDSGADIENEAQIQEFSNKDSRAVGENLDEKITSEEKSRGETNNPDEESTGTEGNGAEKGGIETDDSDEESTGTEGNGAEKGGAETDKGGDGKDSEGNSTGDSSGEEASGEADESQRFGMSSQSGEEDREHTSEMQRKSQPKLAQDGFDPLSEQEAIREPKNQAEKGNQDGETNEKSEKLDSGNKNGDENGSGEGGAKNTSEETGENGNESSRKPGLNGKKPDESHADNNTDDKGGASENNNKQSKKEGKSVQGDESGTESESDEKMKGGQNGSGSRSKEPHLEVDADDDDDDGEDGREPSVNKKQAGKSHGGGAKTESETPEDASNAQSGTENGADSDQNLPDPIKEKENFDGGGLQDSTSRRSDREKIMDEGTGDESDLENILDSDGGLTEKEKTGLKPDPVSSPGEAMEEILKHAGKKKGFSEDQKNSNLDSPAGNASKAPTPLEVPTSTLGDGKVELQKNQEEKSGVGKNNANNEEEREGGRSSNQDGGQRGNEGDRKSRGEIKPDNSVESNGGSEKNHGGNRIGADEQSNQQGAGRDGSNTPNEAGNPAGSGGEGPTGSRGGNSEPTESQTGSPDPDRRSGKGSSGKSGERESQAFGSDSDSKESRRTADGGGSGMGDDAHGLTGREGVIRGSMKEDAVNIDFAREQTVLALNHLRDSLDKDDKSLLEYLGWTREEARRFLQEWEKLHDVLENENTSLEERKSAENRFQSLGLVPRSFRYREQISTEKQRPAVRSGRKIEPPEAWRELFEAYSRGVGDGN